MSSAKAAPAPERPRLVQARMVECSPATVEEMFKAATMLQHGLNGLMAEASEEGGCNLDRDDFYPFWELSLGLVRDLRQLHREGESVEAGR